MKNLCRPTQILKVSLLNKVYKIPLPVIVNSNQVLEPRKIKLTMSTKRALNQLPETAFVGLRSAMTMEEVDCERRGYKLTKTILGTGGYAKVKLAYVMEKKTEKEKRLAEDLAEKGHNMVGNLNVGFFFR